MFEFFFFQMKQKSLSHYDKCKQSNGGVHWCSSITPQCGFQEIRMKNKMEITALNILLRYTSVYRWRIVRYMD